MAALDETMGALTLAKGEQAPEMRGRFDEAEGYCRQEETARIAAANNKEEARRARVAFAASLVPPFKSGEKYVTWHKAQTKWLCGGTNTPLKHVGFFFTLRGAINAKAKRLAELDQGNNDAAVEENTAPSEPTVEVSSSSMVNTSDNSPHSTTPKRTGS